MGILLVPHRSVYGQIGDRFVDGHTIEYTWIFVQRSSTSYYNLPFLEELCQNMKLLRLQLPDWSLFVDY